MEQLAARDITVVTGAVSALEIADDHLTGVRLRSGEVIPLRALAVGSRLVPRSGVLNALGLKPTAHPSGMGEYIAADSTGRTAPGVWVAGNLADIAANVLGAAATGAMAAHVINADLISEDTSSAVHARRDSFSPGVETRNCETVLGDRRHGS